MIYVFDDARAIMAIKYAEMVIRLRYRTDVERADVKRQPMGHLLNGNMTEWKQMAPGV